MKRFQSTSHTRHEYFDGEHRYEHWYRDNSVYFITAKVRDGFHAFASDKAKAIFWDRLLHWTSKYGFAIWIITLVGNHYHVIAYVKNGMSVGQMMRKIHGSIAKLVNDTLPNRHLPFWRGKGGHDYFDGCLRDEIQCRRAYKYVLTQCRRHRICKNPEDYPHTRVFIDLERGLKRAIELNAFMSGVRYPRYEK